MHENAKRDRPLIAFFDYPDVFEDFYPHFKVDQRRFATSWSGTGSHAFLRLIQRSIGDTVWYAFSVSPQLTEARHETVGCRIKILPSSLLHRILWRAFYLPRAAWRWRRAYPLYATPASYLSILSVRFLTNVLRDRPDLLFVQDYATGKFDMLVLLSRVLGVPVVAWHSGSQPSHYLGKSVKHLSIRAATRIIASSRLELEMLAERYEVSRDRLSVVLTPIDTSVFEPMSREQACKEAGLRLDDRYCLFMGRLDDNVKRVSLLLRAFACALQRRRGVTLLIAGDGPDRARLERLAREIAPGRVRFLGWISDMATKRALYNASDCLVLTSKREGFPTVVAEAMACGTPVLSAEVGGVTELVVEEETGWLFAANRKEELCAKLGLVFESALPEQMRYACRARAEHRVAPEVVTSELEACFAGAWEESRQSS